MRVLLIEKTYSGIASLIRDDHVAITRAVSADEAILLLQQYTYDLVLLSTREQFGGGFDLIRRMRAANHDTLVLALTGPRIEDKTQLLRQGADEALTEPIDPAELRARISSLLRRKREISRSLLRAGDLHLCLTTREVRFGDMLLRTSPKEFAMLELLVRHKGTALTRTALLNHLYGVTHEEPEIRIIDVLICTLRKKLHHAGASNIIRAVRDHGYMLCDLDAITHPTPGIMIRLGHKNKTDFQPIQVSRNVQNSVNIHQTS